jgi:hypothetical protein
MQEKKDKEIDELGEEVKRLEEMLRNRVEKDEK